MLITYDLWEMQVKIQLASAAHLLTWPKPKALTPWSAARKVSSKNAAGM
jgi:hypothetical protein